MLSASRKRRRSQSSEGSGCAERKVEGERAEWGGAAAVVGVCAVCVCVSGWAESSVGEGVCRVAARAAI